jgi:hypothetical protein
MLETAAMNEAPQPSFNPAGPAPGEAADLARIAARSFADALGVARTLHEPGQGERYRLLLAAAIDHGNRAVAATTAAQPPPGGDEPLTPTLDSTRLLLAKAHAARAKDALHGAGQLSLSAQRAPTAAACDDGWQRVEAIVSGAEQAARAAVSVAGALTHDSPGSVSARRATAAAEDAQQAARAARTLIEQRNHAYTFHTDAGFSFGEGWYLAAAAVLAGVAIQLGPGNGDGVLQARTFLRDAGLCGQLQPYRPRPRAMKHVTHIIGSVFRADPAAAQRKLRAAFLGDTAVPGAVRAWIDPRLAMFPAQGKVLLWIRHGVHHPTRNTAYPELLELIRLVQQAGLTPILTGDALRGGDVPAGVIDMILFWKDPIFRQADTRYAQLQFFEHLRMAHGVIGQLGVTTAGMDGPALMGLPTLYLTDQPNVRMREWVGSVPGYREVVREPGFLADVSRTLCDWAAAGTKLKHE